MLTFPSLFGHVQAALLGATGNSTSSATATPGRRWPPAARLRPHRRPGRRPEGQPGHGAGSDAGARRHAEDRGVGRRGSRAQIQLIWPDAQVEPGTLRDLQPGASEYVVRLVLQGKADASAKSPVAR